MKASVSKFQREGVLENKNITSMNVFEDQRFELIIIGDALLQVSESKLKLHLTNHVCKLGKKNSWTYPVSLASGFLISLVTFDFEKTTFLKGMKIVFIIILIICFFWFFYTLKYKFQSITIDDIITELKKDQINFENKKIK